jgi:hypothetical protein
MGGGSLGWGGEECGKEGVEKVDEGRGKGWRRRDRAAVP